MDALRWRWMNSAGSAPLSPVAWKSLVRLASGRVAWGHACRFARRAREELMAAGVLAVWHLPRGDYLTLSPLGAARLGLALRERDEPGAVPYWADAAAPEPPWTVEPGTILLRRPELVPVKHKSVLEYLCDRETGEEVRIFGVPVRIDRRLARGRGRAAARAG